MTAFLMLPTLLSARALMLPPVDLAARLQAAAKLEDALERATSAEGNASETLGLGVEAARQALGPESEVARTALFLLGSDSHAITGEVLTVDCGYSLMGM